MQLVFYKNIKFLFLPDWREIEIEHGTSIFRAAKRSGLYIKIERYCGRKGVCGKFRSQINNGHIKQDINSIILFKKEEIMKALHVRL